MQLFHPHGYSIACDKCGKTFSLGGRKVFVSAYAVVEAAKGKGWKSLKSKTVDVCPDCRKTHEHL